MTLSPDGSLAALRRQIFEPHLLRCAEATGVDFNGESLVLPFFSRNYRVSSNAILDLQGKAPTDAVGLVLCRYVLRYPSSPPPDGRMVTFREFSGAGPLVSSFARNTNKLVASAFAHDPEALIAGAGRLNGKTRIDADGWDVSVRFQALPNVPMFLRFNAADDLFPAQCSILFFQSAAGYLDMKSLFVLGTWLAGNLLSDKSA